MSAITLGRINSKVFYVIEFVEIPIGNESYRSIMVENNIVIEMRFVISVQAAGSSAGWPASSEG